MIKVQRAPAPHNSYAVTDPSIAGRNSETDRMPLEPSSVRRRPVDRPGLLPPPDPRFNPSPLAWQQIAIAIATRTSPSTPRRSNCARGRRGRGVSVSGTARPNKSSLWCLRTAVSRRRLRDSSHPSAGRSSCHAPSGTAHSLCMPQLGCPYADELGS